MRFAMLVLLIVAVPLWAQTPTPNTLTPEQAREGWILLFDGKSTLGWDAKGVTAVRDGHVVFVKAGLGKQAGDKFVGQGSPPPAFSIPATGDKFVWRGSPPPTFSLTAEVRGGVLLLQKDAKSQIIANPNFFGFDNWKTKDTSLWNIVSFEFTGHDDRAAIRSIKLRPEEMRPLFNGKNLAGWKIFDGKKSKFDVKDGLLTIENGPGDLQTIAKYKNFLLQLECKTNGKHLNSGVFFRCRAGEYQNGYEAQINNNFTASPPKDYVVEEFDPQTNKLLDKKKVKSTAADFGTGSIYRRIPATMDIAKDGEWFTMTILAHGNHFATWVNGIQTVDWYDNRPPNDNARNGYRSEGGHISLQGHDPTTNLSFRNIRIAELPD